MVLVIGATGYIGRYLCPYLKEHGFDILATGRSKQVQMFFEKESIRFQYLDLFDESSLSKLPAENIDAVVDLSACLAELETPVERFFQINTLGVQKLLEFCRKNDIMKFILTSTHKVYNDVDKLVISEDDRIRQYVVPASLQKRGFSIIMLNLKNKQKRHYLNTKQEALQ